MGYNGTWNGWLLKGIEAISPEPAGPPAISNVSAATAATSAMVTWDTNRLADTQVQYRPVGAGSYSFTPLSNAPEIYHGVNIEGLSPGTQYEVVVRSQDWQQTAVVSTAPGAFATPPATHTLSGSCPDPPRIYRDNTPLDCTVSAIYEPPTFNHNAFGVCRTIPSAAGLAVAIVAKTFSNITIRMTATAAVPAGSYQVQCQAGGNWYTLWRDLQVLNGCTAISSVQVNGQSTSTVILGSRADLRITGTCFTGATSLRLGSQTITPFQVVSDSVITATYNSATGDATGTRALTVAAQGTATSNMFATRLSITRVAHKGSLAITRDEPGLVLAAAPSPPVWTSASPSMAHPATYVAGASLAVDVVVTASPVPSSAVPGVRIEGSVAGLGKLVKTGVTISGGSADTAVADVTSESTAFFPAGTKFHNPMTIAWSLSADGAACGSGCASLGSSSNEVLVTLATPLPAAWAECASGSCVPLTVLRLAVEVDGAATPSQATASTWSRFTGGPPSVRGWNGRKLYYYGAEPGVPAAGTACPWGFDDPGPLLRDALGRGQCSQFATLMRAALAANGVTADFMRILPRSTIELGSPVAMVIKNWIYSPIEDEGHYYLDHPGFPYELALNGTGSMQPPRSMPYGDLTNAPGLSGQNMGTPGEKVFANHIILRLPPEITGLSRYVNPSYGASYTGESEFHSAAVEGYAVPLSLGDDRNGLYSPLLKFRPPSPWAVGVCFTTGSPCP
jgi:hypothetical protein